MAQQIPKQLPEHRQPSLGTWEPKLRLQSFTQLKVPGRDDTNTNVLTPAPNAQHLPHHLIQASKCL